ncbi:hypothetical protein FS749_010862 [Ceratobasidium sp. UAMH 11750]|nr:hypothetical protein FS749_010862 [Ceratobasidium sp. UAMH 11750]
MALTVFDKLAGSDGLSAGWGKRAKMNTRQEIWILPSRRNSSQATHRGPGHPV